MKALLKISAFVFVIFLSNGTANSAVCTALITGNWTSPLTWSCGAAPSCGDIIIIPVGITVTVDNHVNLDETSGCNSPTFVMVFGTLQMQTGRKMYFAAGSSVQIMVGGFLLKGAGGGNSNEINITGATPWIAGDGSKPGFFLIGAPFGLPVEFEEFNVSTMGNEFTFSISVASERENKQFDIDYSIDGIDWVNVITIESIGDHTTGYSYEENLTNEGLSSTTVYFRLSQTDINGTKTLLDTKSIKLEQGDFTVYPNPANVGEKIHLSIDNNDSEQSELLIFNSLGQIIDSEIVNLVEGRNDILIETTNMKKGIYFIKLSSSMGKEMYKVMVN